MRKIVQTEIDRLKRRDIKGLSKVEVQLLREHIQATSDYFLTRVSKVLRKTRKEADIDAARMVRKSIETMGVPINLYYHRPKVDKTRLILFWMFQCHKVSRISFPFCLFDS